mgnify:FL=1
MIKSYYSRNAFFNDIIDEYYKNDPNTRWIKHDEPQNFSYICDIDFHHQNKVIDCRIISQINGIELLGNKKLQYRLMEQYKPESIGDYIPRTYLFNRSNINYLKNVLKSSKKYIIKPENGLSIKGVTIINDYTSLYNEIKNSQYKCNWILQDYVENPLLYNGRKFHFRIYVLLVRDSYELKVHMYNKGFMYFANKKYKINSIDNESHLSGESSRNNVKVYPEDFSGYFGDQYIQTINDQLRKIIKNTIEPVAVYLKSKNENIPGFKAFKLLGYDILIDKFNKCYLAEINTRQISLKYPPPEFKKEMYTHLLYIIHYPNKPTEFTHVNTITNKVIIKKSIKNPNPSETIDDSCVDNSDKRIEHFKNSCDASNTKKINKINNLNSRNDKLSLFSKLANFKTWEEDEKLVLYVTIVLLIIVIIGIYTSIV